MLAIPPAPLGLGAGTWGAAARMAALVRQQPSMAVARMPAPLAIPLARMPAQQPSTSMAARLAGPARASLSRIRDIPEARYAATSGTMRSCNGLLLLTVKQVLEPKWLRKDDWRRQLPLAST